MRALQVVAFSRLRARKLAATVNAPADRNRTRDHAVCIPYRAHPPVLPQQAWLFLRPRSASTEPGRPCLRCYQDLSYAPYCTGVSNAVRRVTIKHLGYVASPSRPSHGGPAVASRSAEPRGVLAVGTRVYPRTPHSVALGLLIRLHGASSWHVNYTEDIKLQKSPSKQRLCESIEGTDAR